MFKEIPKDHKPCLDIVGIDTCLWKYVIIKERKYETFHGRSYNHIPDTIKIPPIVIPIKKYRLINKSKQEVEKLTVLDVETVSVQFFIIEQEETIFENPFVNQFKIIVRNFKIPIKEVTPLNYGD